MMATSQNPVTPWRNWVTRRPAPFSTDLEGTMLMVGVGDPSKRGSVAFTGTLSGLFVTRMPGGTEQEIRVPTYRIVLSPWRGDGVPEICLHPLALPHLFVSEQIGRGDATVLLGPDSPYVVERSITESLTSGYDVLRQLRVPRAYITLSTVFNVTVRPYRPQAG